MLIIPFIINAQTFKKVYTFEKSTIPIISIETNDGYIIGNFIYNGNVHNIRYKFNSNLIKLDKYGNIKKQINIDNNYIDCIQEIWTINDTTYGALSVFAEEDSSKFKVCYFQFNNNLEISIKDTLYFKDSIAGVNGLKHIASDLYIDKNNNTVCTISLYPFHPLKYQLLIMKINNKGKILKYNSFLPESDEYYITTNKQGGYYLIKGCFANELYTMDSNLNEFKRDFYIPDDWNNLEDDLIYAVGTQWKNDTILTVFTTDGYDHNFQMGYYELTIINGECKEKNYYYRFPFKDPDELAAEYNAVDKFGDYTFFAARTNVFLYSDNVRDTNATRIIKLNKNNSVVWDKIYDFNAWHWAMTITATKDGGCLVAGTETCFTCPENIGNLYVLKIDSTGYAEGADITDNISQKPHYTADITIYPNPGNNTINMQLPDNINNAELSIFNISGKMIISKHLNNGLNTVSTDNLKSGIYFYRIITNGKVLSKGKWVKE